MKFSPSIGTALFSAYLLIGGAALAADDMSMKKDMPDKDKEAQMMKACMKKDSMGKDMLDQECMKKKREELKKMDDMKKKDDMMKKDGMKK